MALAILKYKKHKIMSTSVKKYSSKFGYMGINPIVNTFNVNDWNKFTAVVKVFSLLSDDESASNSKKILDSINKKIEILPQEKIEDIEKAKKLYEEVNQNYKSLENFLDGINSFINKNNVEIDDKHVKTMLTNLSKAKDLLNYVSDYLDLAIEVYYAKEEIKSSKTTYTFEELQKELCEA